MYFDTIRESLRGWEVGNGFVGGLLINGGLIPLETIIIYIYIYIYMCVCVYVCVCVCVCMDILKFG